jgi:hypothetical protein
MQASKRGRSILPYPFSEKVSHAADEMFAGFFFWAGIGSRRFVKRRREASGDAIVFPSLFLTLLQP